MSIEEEAQNYANEHKDDDEFKATGYTGAYNHYMEQHKNEVKKQKKAEKQAKKQAANAAYEKKIADQLEQEKAEAAAQEAADEAAFNKQREQQKAEKDQKLEEYKSSHEGRTPLKQFLHDRWNDLTNLGSQVPGMGVRVGDTSIQNKDGTITSLDNGEGNNSTAGFREGTAEANAKKATKKAAKNDKSDGVASTDTNAINTSVQATDVSTPETNTTPTESPMEADFLKEMEKERPGTNEDISDYYHNERLKNFIGSIGDWVNEPGISATEKDRRKKEGNYYAWNALSTFVHNLNNNASMRQFGLNNEEKESDWKTRQNKVFESQNELNKDILKQAQDKNIEWLTTKMDINKSTAETLGKNYSDILTDIQSSNYSPAQQKARVDALIAIGEIYKGLGPGATNALYTALMYMADGSDEMAVAVMKNNMSLFSQSIQNEIKAGNAVNILTQTNANLQTKSAKYRNAMQNINIAVDTVGNAVGTTGDVVGRVAGGVVKGATGL